jgi:multicomponent Na+:H+ antiporter subunit D
VQAGLETENYLIVAVALLVGVLTLLVVAQIWSRAFWSPAREEGLVSTDTLLQRSVLQAPIVVLAAVLFIVGCYAQPLFDLAHQAAVNLTDTTPYIQAVLG